MTDREVMQQALEALEAARSYDIPPTSQVRSSITALQAALEQQAEPGTQCSFPKCQTTGGCVGACTRSTQSNPPQQQAEPVACIIDGDLYFYHEIVDWEDLAHQGHEVKLLYTAPPQRQWDKTSFNDWWDGDYDDSENRFEKDSAAYWAWAGWQAAKRPWVGLTDEEVNQKSASIDERLKLAFHAGMYVAQKILKEKNDH